jgi:hypothetical protein
MVDVLQRMEEYDKPHCWQYDIRINNLEEDLKMNNLSKEFTDKLTPNDFVFELIPQTDKKRKKELTDFIKRHEWLGNISQFTTHWFGAYLEIDDGFGGKERILSGVILMNQPNMFSKMLGEDTKNLERLVSRGACISWSPKNLASKFLMWCIDYMVKNTQYRLFTAYSDSTAKEIGTIYQACNWYYLGQTFGTTKRYINPYNGKLVSDRVFRSRSFYKRYAKELGIEWKKEWNSDNKINWDLIPDEIEEQLREMSKKKQKESKVIEFPSKHKYAYVKGRDKSETKYLRKKFLEKNKIYPYPKER